MSSNQWQSNYTSDEIADAEETKSEYVDEESLDMAEEFFEEVSEDKCCEEVDREEKMTKNDSVIAINDIVYQCEFCDKIYRWPTSLNRHRKHCTKRQVSSKNKGQSIEVEEIHVNETEEEEVKDSKAHDIISASRFREVQKYTPIAGTYKCWDCGRVYQWASSLSRHRTIECGPRNKMKFVCTMCSYKTGYRGNFLRHLKAPRHMMNRHYGKRISEGTLKRVKEVTIEATEDDN